MTILPLILLAVASVDSSPATTQTISISAPAPTSPSATCDRCEMARPITPFRQWDIDHAFAHHLVDVLLRMQARRITMDAGTVRDIAIKLRDGMREVRDSGTRGELVALLAQAIETVKMLVLRVEQLEGEIQRRRTP